MYKCKVITISSAYIAASRRSDCILESQVKSARLAIHPRSAPNARATVYVPELGRRAAPVSLHECSEIEREDNVTAAVRTLLGSVCIRKPARAESTRKN